MIHQFDLFSSKENVCSFPSRAYEYYLILAFVKSFVLPVCSKKLSANIILEPVCKSGATVRSP